MRASSLRSLALGSRLLLAVAGPAPAAAQVPLLPGTWLRFEWFAAPGPVEGGGFTVGSAFPLHVRVTDALVSGDAFDVFANGVPVLSTPSVPGGVDTGAGSGDAAWADPALSKGAFDLAPGAYLITVDVREAGSGFPDGEGFIRADLANVPEPATVALVGVGVAALGAVAGRRPR